MSSRRRRLPRRSASPGRSIGESLLGKRGGQREGHLVRALELEPVAGALEDLEPEGSGDESMGALGLGAAERRVAVAPQQRRRGSDTRVPLEALPRALTREVRA